MPIFELKSGPNFGLNFSLELGRFFTKNVIQNLGPSFGPINLFHLVFFSLSVYVLSNKQTKQIELCTFPSASVSPEQLKVEQLNMFRDIHQL